MSPSSTDASYVRRAIRLAMNGRGLVEPNPMVGCVLVKDGHIIGEGNHAIFGGPHAEPTALQNCRDRGNSPVGATAFVTLEPCCHLNKKTPPCAPLLIREKVARVVIGCLDPNPDVNGKGVAMLQEAGIEVRTRVCEDEAKQLIAPFLARVNLGRPYVTLKWAQSIDGKIAGGHGERLQISGLESSHLVHQLRSRSDAILVGVNTVLADNPMLTVRGVVTHRPLLRVVLDTSLNTPADSTLVRTATDHPTLIFCSRKAWMEQKHQRVLLESAGVEVVAAGGAESNGVSFAPVLQLLGRGAEGLPSHFPICQNLMVEPGPTLARSMIAANVVDRIWVFQSPTAVDDDSAPNAAAVPVHFVKVGDLQVGADTLTEYLNPQSPVFAAPVTSADFVVACDAAQVF